MPKWVVAAASAAAVIALLVAGLLWWRSLQMTELERALSVTPADAQRLSWTDWAAVRDETGADLSASSSPRQVTSFLDKGYEADLTSSSALLQSASAMHERFGFSPATLDWELFSQSEEGAVVVMRLPEGTDFDELAQTLDGLGYQRPDDDTGVWRGGGEVLARISTELTPELAYLAIDEDRRLVLASDQGDYVGQAMDTVTGDEDAVDGLDAVVEASGEPLSAAIYTGDLVCRELAMTAADPADQAQAEELIQAAGEVNPIAGFAMSIQPDRDITVIMEFESDDQAQRNADSRGALARGPAPGQGGNFSDRFAVAPVTAEDSLVRMELEPVEGQYVFSDLSSGPVLFATC